MNPSSPTRYDQAIQEAVERLEADGWHVETQAIVPELSGYRADYIARLGDQMIVGEVKYRGQNDLRQLGPIANIVSKLPHARLEMTWLGQVEEESKSHLEIVQMADAAIRVAEVDRAAGLLLAWSALEGATRLRVSVEDVRVRPYLIRQRLTEMANLGEISVSQFDYLNNFGQLRNRIAHGRYPQPDQQAVEYVATVARAIAEDSYFSVEQMVEWFLENYKDPAKGVPYDSRNGGYQYFNGGPYNAEEVLREKFFRMPWRDINTAASEVLNDGGVLWVGKDEY